MKILYHHRTQGEGVERVHILGIVNAWRSAGHYVDIVSPPGVSLNHPEKTEINNDNGNIWKHVVKYIPEFGFELFEIAYNFWVYISLTRETKRKVYDFIFERYSFLCFAGLLASKRHGIPFFLEVNYTSYTPIFRQRTRFIKPFERWIEHIVFKKADGIIVVSTYLKEHLLSLGINGDKIIVLSNAADPSKFNPDLKADNLKKQLKLKKRKVVGFVGYFYTWHGIEFFLDTYKYVNKNVGGVVYLLVGDGPIYKKISEMVTQRKLHEKILLVGSVDHEEIPKYITLFDVAVMPHSNNYGSPMKVLEYMAMGKAVVAPRLGPLEDVIQDGMNGLLFDPEDEEDLINKILIAVNNDEIRIDIGKAARLSILEKHNWHKNAQEILNLYNRVLQAVNTGI